MFKKGLLILTLCLSTIGLSGCGKSAADGVEFVNNLDVEIQEITISQELKDYAKENENENSSVEDEEPGYIVNITNNTKYYFNNMPVGIIVDENQLTLDDLQKNEYEVEDAFLILAPGDTFTTEIESISADSKVTLVPDYEEGKPVDDLTADSDIKDLDDKFFDKYVTKESSDKMLYPSDITVETVTYEKDPNSIFPLLLAEITNNSDKDIAGASVEDQLPFTPFVINDNQLMGAAIFLQTDAENDNYTFSLPANGTATAKFLYIGPENLDNYTLTFNGLAL